jgi:hypothetical protein
VLVEPVGLAQWAGLGEEVVVVEEEEEAEEEENQAQAPAPEVQMADVVFGGCPQNAGSRSLRCQMSILR